MRHAAIATAAHLAAVSPGGGYIFRQGWRLLGRYTAEYLEHRVGQELVDMCFSYEDNTLEAELPLDY